MSVPLLDYLRSSSPSTPLSLSSKRRCRARHKFYSFTDQFPSVGAPYSNRVVSFSRDFDELLCGGIAIGEVTEISARPGTGKSQLCFQLAVDVQIPLICGGNEGQALYIDCDGSFNANRCADIAHACVSHLQKATAPFVEMAKSVESLTVESLLGGILVQQCKSYTHLFALLHQIPDLLQTRQSVKLLVIDSVASIFRHGFKDYSLRSKLLIHVMQSLARLAHDKQIAVVVTNQIVTRFGLSREDPAYFIPALGDSWGHAASLRLLIEIDAEDSDGENARVLTIVKSRTAKRSSTRFKIDERGIRDVGIAL